jgi:NDP-sugar pyrophosphorylase family protein
MVLAAGLGTRLRPLTDNRPKALVTVAGRTLLEIALLTLRSYGVDEVILNVHHFADMICEYLDENGNFGMHIEVSHEDGKLLDTGGGLKKAAWFFLKDGSDEPFILHNVDVLSTIDLARMVRHHVERGAMATLAVQERESSRYLLFDENGRLCGRRVGRERRDEMVRATAPVQSLAFSGIHVISPRLLMEMREEGAFSIIDAYLDLAARGEEIAAFRADEYFWRDLGRPEHIAETEREVARQT